MTFPKYTWDIEKKERRKVHNRLAKINSPKSGLTYVLCI